MNSPLSVFEEIIRVHLIEVIPEYQKFIGIVCNRRGNGQTNVGLVFHCTYTCLARELGHFFVLLVQLRSEPLVLWEEVHDPMHFGSRRLHRRLKI